MSIGALVRSLGPLMVLMSAVTLPILPTSQAEAAEECFLDWDQDGYGTAAGTVVVSEDGTCDASQHESSNALDCDDGDSSILPGQTETWYDGIDADCDARNDFDQDGDGYVRTGDEANAGGSAPKTGDCNDTDFRVHPGAREIIDAIDNDCSGEIDDVAQETDSDGDGISDAIEGAADLVDTDADGTPDYLDLDSDNDAIPDAIEGGTSDFDADLILDFRDVDSDNDFLRDGQEDLNGNGLVDVGETDRVDGDTDDDGLLDGEEDANGNGSVDAGETVPFDSDTDGDGLLDGQEEGRTHGTSGTDPALFRPDSDPDTTTPPTDDDADDDGLMDGSEDTNMNGMVAPGETDPVSFDSDGDGLNDGLERGLTVPQGQDTQVGWIPDSDPLTVTDPLNADTDGDGALDGIEDANQNGAVDPGETDPNIADAPQPPPVSGCSDDVDEAIRVTRHYQKTLRQLKRACTGRDTAYCSDALAAQSETFLALDVARALVEQSCVAFP